MVLSYRLDHAEAAGSHFDAAVRRIQAGKFTMAVLLESGIFGECDLRTLCRAEGTIEAEVGSWLAVTTRPLRLPLGLGRAVSHIGGLMAYTGTANVLSAPNA